jgi:hypothetical protein
LDQLTNKIRKGHSIEVSAFETAMPLRKENASANPVLGTLTPAPNTYNHKRMVSRHETRRTVASKRRNPLISLVGRQSNDLAHVPPPRPKNKTCSICKCPGHQRGSCPKINKFKAPPLEMGKEINSRHELSSALSKLNRYKTDHQGKEDTQEISPTLPSRLIGIVIHQRFFMNCSTTKMCLECTILGPMGDAHSTFECFLFTVEVISTYVSKSKSNVVICELDDACHEGYESFGFSLSQTQPPVQHVQHLAQYGMQQLSQLSQTQPPIQQVEHLSQYGIQGMSQAEYNQMGYGQMSADL